jgi:hypothetical protein
VWEAWVEGMAEPVQVRDWTGLNASIVALLAAGTIDRPAYYAEATGCDASLCELAATGTVLWAPPGQVRVQKACDEHLAEYQELAAGAEAPVATLAQVVRLPESAFYRSSGPRMETLTRGLIGVSVPAEVFPQPACVRCKARVCPALTPGRLEWADAEGSVKCGRRASGHVLPPDAVIAGVIERYYQLDAVCYPAASGQ